MRSPTIVPVGFGTHTSITLHRYEHLMPGNEDEEASLLDGYLARAGSQDGSRRSRRSQPASPAGTQRAMPEESTTPDLVELGQRFFDAMRARDFDAAVSFFAPHGVWDLTAAGMGVFEGREAIRGFFEDWLGAYEDYELETEESRDLGGGVVFSVLVQRGRMPGSTGWVTFRTAGVSTWVDGLIERIARYPDIDEGRSAAERLAGSRV